MVARVGRQAGHVAQPQAWAGYDWVHALQQAGWRAWACGWRSATCRSVQNKCVLSLPCFPLLHCSKLEGMDAWIKEHHLSCYSNRMHAFPAALQQA